MKLARGFITFLVLTLAVAGLILTGCAGSQKKLTSETMPDTFPCVDDDGKVEKMIADEVELAEFNCSIKKWEGAETLHFNVAVKNISNVPQRYRVNIFLDNGKAVGGLIPRKTKKGLVEPGQTASFVYPVKGVDVKPEEIILKIDTMAP